MGVPVNPAHYTGLLAPAIISNGGYDDLDPEMDALLVEASQQVESELISWENDENDCRKLSRFGPPQSDADIKKAKESRVPKNTLKNTSWAQQVWQQWATERLQRTAENEGSCDLVLGVDLVLHVDIRKMSNVGINHWLQRFMLETRKSNWEHHSSDSFHQICCGIQRAIRAAGNTDINFFDGKEFTPFRELMDGELKRLNGTGKYVYK